MLAVPCGLPSYRGAWPPVAAGAPLIAPFEHLARCSAHAAASEHRRRLTAGEPVVQDGVPHRPASGRIDALGTPRRRLRPS